MPCAHEKQNGGIRENWKLFKLSTNGDLYSSCFSQTKYTCLMLGLLKTLLPFREEEMRKPDSLTMAEGRSLFTKLYNKQLKFISYSSFKVNFCSCVKSSHDVDHFNVLSNLTANF